MYKKLMAPLALSVLPFFGWAQNATIKATPKVNGPGKLIISTDWHLRSFEKDTFYGTGVSRAYAELLSGKQPTKVIVAVLDTGVDTVHVDLKQVLWTNKKEKPGNGRDDDRNGYVDDVHGWNFLGSANGKENLSFVSKETDREYLRLSQLYAGKDLNSLGSDEKTYYNYVKKYSSLYTAENNIGKSANLDRIDSAIKAQFSNQPVTFKELAALRLPPGDKELALAFNLIRWGLQNKKLDSTAALNSHITAAIASSKKSSQENYQQLLASVSMDYRAVVFDGNKRKGATYGNNVTSLISSDHGTHVGGIIGADRTNGEGIQGIADAVEIMSVRMTVPSGDEYDEDVANAIRYAVDNGARVINMSFGKRVSPNKAVVDKAFKYAEKKGVLIVRGAGNDSEDTDSLPFYPNQFYARGGKASNVLTVGATDAQGRVANFSSYGRQSVDIFAPGVNVYSTIPVGGYGYKSGTSMATPVVSGVAALIMSYYPKLTAQQVKDILMRTVTKVQPVTGKNVLSTNRNLEEVSVSGGIVNAYEALKLAEQQR